MLLCSILVSRVFFVYLPVYHVFHFSTLKFYRSQIGRKVNQLHLFNDGNE